MATRLALPAHAVPVSARWSWALVGLAWALALLATRTGGRALVDHHFLIEQSGLPSPVAALVFLAGWQVMIVAMMLPASMPALTHELAGWRSASRRPWRRAFATFLAGYASVWMVFGLLAFAGDTLIHQTVDRSPWLAAHTSLIGAAALLAAGAFQLTPGKSACRARCRAPSPSLGGAAAGPWPTQRAWEAGARQGWASLGCCWALMLVMFGLGVGDLAWMAGLTGVMVAETATVGGLRLARVAGALLLLLGGLWLFHPAWLVLAAGL